MFRPAILFPIIAMAIPFGVSAAELVVPLQYATIQSALDASAEGDEVVILSGTYLENILLPGRDLVIRSAAPHDPAVVAATIIDGSASGSVITCNGSETSATRIEGLTIRNGRANRGAGIAGNQSAAGVYFSIIEENEAPLATFGTGGGIEGLHGEIRECLIRNNSAANGGGIARCDGLIFLNEITGNQVTGNTSSAAGGGVWGGTGRLVSNRIHRNRAIGNGAFGGGIANHTGLVQNNLIYRNSATRSGGAFGLRGVVVNNTIANNSASITTGGIGGSTGLIVGLIVWGNTGGNPANWQSNTPPISSCVQGWVSGGRNTIGSDPLFVDPTNDDFRLQDGSPAINASLLWYQTGPWMSGADGLCRLSGGSVDMGALEFAATADKDGDLLPDSEEEQAGGLANLWDTDGDGLCDGAEVSRGTSAAVADTPVVLHVADTESVQRALFWSLPKETIHVSPGEYRENLYSLGKEFLLTGSSPSHTASTRINAEQVYAAMVLGPWDGESTRLRWMTFENGSAPVEDGGCIQGHGSPASVQDCILRNGRAGRGGGIDGLSGSITGSTIQGNSAGAGGGLHNCHGLIEGNRILDNTAQREGGGISFCQGDIVRNLIAGNRTTMEDSKGGGIYFSMTTGRIAHNIIVNNSAVHEGGGAHTINVSLLNNTIAMNRTTAVDGNGGGLHTCTGEIRNAILWGNLAFEEPNTSNNCSVPSYSIWDDNRGEGNLIVDPLFVDAAAGDFHLAENSPAIDAGSLIDLPAVDHGGQPIPYDGSSAARGDGSDVDMGADEWQPPSPPVALTGWAIF